MSQTQVTELMDFTGGMNTLVAPHLISPRESTVLINVDIRLGSLASMPNLEHREQLASGGHFYEFNNTVYSYRTYRDNVTWDDKWYWSDGLTTGKILADGTELPLGIPTPTKAVDINLGTTEGPHTGAFKYTYTFYSTETNVESAPAPLQDLYLLAEADVIELTNMEALPEGANTYRIYRIGGYLPVFTLVRSTQLNTFTDNFGDTNVDGRQIQTMYSGMPPEGLVNLTEYNGRFYGSLGNKVYYSALGNPDAWYLSDYFMAKDTIVGIAAAPGGLLIIGKFFTMLMYGQQPTDYRIKLLSDQLGCIDKRSIAYIGDSAIWLSHRSFVMSNGYTVTDITAHKIDNLRGILPTGAVTEDSTYFMSFMPQLVPEDDLYPEDTLYPALIDGTGGLDEGIIALDFKRGNGFSYKLISYNKIVSLGMVQGEVHVGTGAAKENVIQCDRNLFYSCLDFIPCSGYALNRLSMYNGQGLAPLKYMSPRLADGSLATLKEYDKVRVVYTGVFNIKVLFDNGDVVVERNTAELDKQEGFIIIGIPNSNNKSQFIRFLVEGKGIINTIQYSWKAREVIT